MSVNRVAAAAGSRQRGGGKNRRRVEKHVYVETKTVRPNKRGTFRLHNDYRLPEHLGGGVVTVRLHAATTTPDGSSTGPENVRQIAPGDPDFEVLYRRRNEAESINRHLDDTLWLRRAPLRGSSPATAELDHLRTRRERSVDAGAPPKPRPAGRRLISDTAITAAAARS